MPTDTSRNIAQYEFDIIRGDDFVQPFIFPVEIPLVNVTEAKIDFKSVVGVTVLSLSLADGISIVGQTLTITLTDTQSSLLVNDTYYYDCKFVISGFIKHYFGGKINVKPIITI